MSRTKYGLKAIAILITLIMMIPTLTIKRVDAAETVNVSNLYPVDSTYSLIKSLEGYAPQCFWDVAQWTIGYGNKCPYTHTSNGVRGQKGGHTISEAEARELFSTKLSGYVNTLKSNCSGLAMTQNQFDALLSATYNHGNVNSCPLKYYLQGKYTESEAREKYYVWCINAGTADEKGLRNRRKKEADVFFSDPKPVHYDPEGYLDTAEGGYGTVTLTGWALDRDTPNEPCEIHIYMDGPSGQGGTCIATGIMADQASPDVASIIGVGGNHRFSVTLNLDVTGNHSFYAYAINRGGGNNNPQLNQHFSTYIYEKTNSVISNVYISSMTPSGYTVNIAVNDESKVGRIAVPVWTTGNAKTDAEAQDDLASDWQEKCLAKKIGANTYAYYVNTLDHNDESGDYNNDVYVYNQNGELIDRWCYETNHRTHADVPAEKVITNVSTSGLTPSGYMLNINVADESRVGKIAVPVWTTNVAVETIADEPGQDDLISGWQSTCLADRIGTNTYIYAVNTLEHNDEGGEYNNDIYVYDKSGNLIDRWCIETKHRTYVNVPNDKIITDVSIINMTPLGYDIEIKVSDDSVVEKIAVPVWTSYVANETNEYEPGQDDLLSDWQSICFAEKSDSNTYIYHVNISDHNNENGEYCNDVYAYDESGNMIDRWCIETGHRTYAYVPENIRGDVNADGIIDISDAVVLQKWLLAVPDTNLANWKAADLCEDDRLDVFDLCLLKRMLVEQ